MSVNSYKLFGTGQDLSPALMDRSGKTSHLCPNSLQWKALLASGLRARMEETFCGYQNLNKIFLFPFHCKISVKMVVIFMDLKPNKNKIFLAQHLQWHNAVWPLQVLCYAVQRWDVVSAQYFLCKIILDTEPGAALWNWLPNFDCYIVLTVYVGLTNNFENFRGKHLQQMNTAQLIIGFQWPFRAISFARCTILE